MKYGFLFGAGAEVGYGLPSGGQFALDIFRFDASDSKKTFKEMRDLVDPNTYYASQWLPSGFREKNISSFGKAVFQNIIKDTVEHNRDNIIRQINQFDRVAQKEVDSMMNEHIDVNAVLQNVLGKDVFNIQMGQTIQFIDELQQGNELFDSSYYSALLMVYKTEDALTNEQHAELGKILLSILQLHIGALSESLTRKINDGLFAKKDDDIDFFDDIGEIVQLNYSSSGLAGMEYLLDKHAVDISTDGGKCLYFARKIIESIYAAVLDYKSLIDANWHYLYNPSSDWAKFCKICIFLLTVRDYISQIAAKAEPKTKYGYYHLLKAAADKGAFEIGAVATTNYNCFIEEILDTHVFFLNGSTETWYDPYLNRIGTRDTIKTDENHILVPLLFTQSGTKPMTSIEMSIAYVDTYQSWRSVDKIVIVGFGFGSDDEHINGIIRTLIDTDDKKVEIITIESNKTEDKLARDFALKLKTSKYKNISVIKVNCQGKSSDGKMWTEII